MVKKGNEWEVRYNWNIQDLSYDELFNYVNNKLSNAKFEDDLERSDIYFHLSLDSIGLKLRNIDNNYNGSLECKIRNKINDISEHWVKFNFNKLNINVNDLDKIKEIYSLYEPSNRKKTWNDKKLLVLQALNESPQAIKITKQRKVAKGRKQQKPFGKVEIAQFSIYDINNKCLGKYISLNITGKKKDNISNIGKSLIPNKQEFLIGGYPELIRKVLE